MLEQETSAATRQSTRSLAAGERGPRWLLALVWLLAPLTALSTSVAGLRWSDAALAVALLLCLLSPTDSRLTVYLPRTARYVLSGIALIAIGTLLGDLRAGSSARVLSDAVIYAAISAGPLVCLLLVRSDESLRRLLSTAFLLGVTFSSFVAAVGEAQGQGRWEGLTTHPNQLGMTTAMALALLPQAIPARHRLLRTVAAVWLSFVVLETGSRSAVLAAGFVLAVYFTAWARERGLKGFFVVVLVAATLATLAVSSWNPLEDTATGRRLTTGQASASDAAREDLLESGLAGVTLDNTLLGAGGAYFERAPHNVALELLVTGGIVALSGFLLVFMPPVAQGVRSFFSRTPLTERMVYALATTAFVIAILFNNALWARYCWVIVALFAAVELRQSGSTPTPRTHA